MLDFAKSSLKRHRMAILILMSTWGVYLCALYYRILELKPTGLFGGHPYVWADWPLHISMASVFAYKEPQYWFSYHPVFADGPLNYPFLLNLISGTLLRAGLDIYSSFILPSMLLSLLLCLGLYTFYFLSFNSRTSSLLAITLFFCSSGLGFLRFFSDLWNTGNLDLITYPAEYSALPEYQWFNGNVLVAMLLPQRTFLLGLTLALWSINGWKTISRYKTQANSLNPHVFQFILICSGCLGGLTIMAHVHSFLALTVLGLPILLCSWKERRKDLALFATPLILISVSVYFFYYSGGVEKQGFMVWTPGWTAGGFQSWIRQWFFQWGLMTPLAVLSLGLFWKKMSREMRILYLGFFGLFVLGNLWRLQPQSWDNTKIFLWCYLGFSGLAAHFLLLLAKRRGVPGLISLILTLSLLATGVLELIRLQRIDKNTHRISSIEEIELGKKIRAETGPLDRFLTGASHNHFIMMWALRPILMGYAGWTLNFGFPWRSVQETVREIYRGTESSARLLKENKISYVVIGPQEINEFKPNLEYFRKNFPIKFNSKSNQIFDTRTLLD